MICKSLANREMRVFNRKRDTNFVGQMKLFVGLIFQFRPTVALVEWRIFYALRQQQEEAVQHELYGKTETSVNTVFVSM